MHLYLELAKKSFQRQVVYRTATLAGLITNMFFGVLRASILIAVYNAQTSSVPDYSVRDAITYTGMTQAFIGAVGMLIFIVFCRCLCWAQRCGGAA